MLSDRIVRFYQHSTNMKPLFSILSCLINLVKFKFQDFMSILH